jgi:hypothetical protein
VEISFKFWVIDECVRRNARIGAGANLKGTVTGVEAENKKPIKPDALRGG